MAKFMNFNSTVRNAFQNDEAAYMEFQSMLNEATVGQGVVEGRTKKEVNDKIVSLFRAAIGCDEKSTAKEIRKAIRRNQNVIFDLLEEVMDNMMVTGWQNDPFMMKYVEQRNLALGDKNEFYVEDDSMLSVMDISGNHHDIIRQRLGAGTKTSVTTKWVGLKVYAEFERLTTGVEDWGTFVSKIYEAYDYYIKQTIYDAMIGYADAIAATYKKTGTLTAETLRELCEFIERVTGYKVIIMGTRSALRGVTALQNAQFISDDMKQEHYKTGMLGMWEGYELIEIPQGFKRNDLTQNLVANDLLWIMPVADNKFIKLVNEGETQVYQVTDAGAHMDMTYDFEMQQKLGVAILFNLAFGVYKITA